MHAPPARAKRPQWKIAFRELFSTSVAPYKEQEKKEIVKIGHNEIISCSLRFKPKLFMAFLFWFSLAGYQQNKPQVSLMIRADSKSQHSKRIIFTTTRAYENQMLK